MNISYKGIRYCHCGLKLYHTSQRDILYFCIPVHKNKMIQLVTNWNKLSSGFLPLKGHNWILALQTENFTIRKLFMAAIGHSYLTKPYLHTVTAQQFKTENLALRKQDPNLMWFFLGVITTSKTTFNNDQPRSGKEKDLWLETLWKKVNCLKGKSKKETSACPWVPMYVSLIQQCSADV